MDVLTNKVALVVGAGGHIGSSITTHLHSKGLSLILTYSSSKEKVEIAVSHMNSIRPGSAVSYHCDLSNSRCIDNLKLFVSSWKGRLDLLVNSGSKFLPTDHSTVLEKDWDDLLSINVKSYYFLTISLCPLLQRSKGSVIFILDTAATSPFKGYSVYSLTKAAALSLVKSLSLDLAPDIRVNGVAPGILTWSGSSVPQNIINSIPLKRVGVDSEISSAVFYLFNDATYTTGQVLVVDGGRSLR